MLLGWININMPATSAMLIHPKKALHLTHRPFEKGFRILIYDMCKIDHWLKKTWMVPTFKKLRVGEQFSAFHLKGSL